jgi:hypothetical protein
MAKRSRRKPTSRRSAQARGRGPDPGQAGRGHGSSSRPFDELGDFSALLDPAHPLGRLGTLVLMQGLEWQSAALGLYRRALQEGSLDAPVEDRLRSIARSMMGMYLEFVKSIPERREQLIAQHSDLAQAFSDALEDLRRRLSAPSDRPDTSGGRPAASRR